MRDKIIAGLKESIRVKEELLKSQVEIIVRIVEAIVKALKDGGKVILFGNGGSAADAQHLAAELVGRFKLERKGLPALALSTNTSTLTSVGNDYSFAKVFARQIEALGKQEDVAIGISTSGKARNVIEGILAAKAKGIFTIGLTGGKGGELDEVVDLTLIVPSLDTPRIQEAHITVGHLICQLVEEEMRDQG
ncbi:D-sedoheptulose 7-phosphate isomerase [candidate division NPL-UPA2 bacterium]|nr:D-sedoheptulose 7-phosphate isomerase [candidate division NPL-UPA2 bacterium]